MKRYWLSGCAIVAGCLLPSAVSAQAVNDFPKKDDPLHVRVAMYDTLMRGNHINEGIFMQDVIFPPVGTVKPMVGSQEDALEITGAMMAAYCYRYAITKKPEHREQCHEILRGIAQLEKVTGVPGVIARSFNKTDKPLWHEDKHFFAIEWHESTSMPGYRWEGDLSSDKFVDICYMLSLYYDMAADEEGKAIAAGLMDRFMGRIVDYNFKLVDVDNKMTLWGNFCPDLPHQAMNSLEILAGLKSAYRMTGKDRYRAAYRRLIDEYHYDDEAIMAKVIWPEMWNVIWDDKLACKSYWQLYGHESDESLVNKYTMSINRHQYSWANSDYEHVGEIWFAMVYSVIMGENVVTEKTIAAIKNMQGFQRRTSIFDVTNANGSISRVESDREGNAAEMIRNYWFGRYYGFIDPSW